MSSRYVCKLSPEALKKAIAELNEPEDDAVRLAAIDTLRTRFHEEAKDLELIRSDDDFLLRFLRVRKFDQDRAFETLKNYHKERIEMHEIFDLVDDPKKLEDFISEGSVLPLREGRAKDGTFVLIVRPGRVVAEHEDTFKFLAAIIVTLEKLLENEEFQVYGLCAIEDLADLGLKFAMHMAVHSQGYMNLVQNSMPLRLKATHLVNEGAIFDAFYAVAGHFMNEKTKNRLKLHGSEVKGLHDYVDPKYLPFFLGGSGPDLNADWWERELLAEPVQDEDTEM